MKGSCCTPFRLLLAAILAATALGAANPALAQFFDESVEQEDLFVEDEERFLEPRGDQFGLPGIEQDFTEGDRFVDESLVPADRRGVTETGRRFELTLGREREELPINIAWGAGTGLLIGGWFALVGEGDNRDTQRSIGVGIVVGILLGAAVGTRSLFNPDAPRPVGALAPPKDPGPTFTPLVSLERESNAVGFRMNF